MSKKASGEAKTGPEWLLDDRDGCVIAVRVTRFQNLIVGYEGYAYTGKTTGAVKVIRRA